jgi:hypothetical protein
MLCHVPTYNQDHGESMQREYREASKKNVPQEKEKFVFSIAQINVTYHNNIL